MCMAEQNLHALQPADTQFHQQQLKTQIGSQPERVAYKSLGQQSKKYKLLQPIEQVGAMHNKGRENAELVYTRTEFSTQIIDLRETRGGLESIRTSL